jgi:hypothetical protein
MGSFRWEFSNGPIIDEYRERGKVIITQVS